MKTKVFTITESRDSKSTKEPNADQTVQFRLKDENDDVQFVGKMRPASPQSVFLPLDTFGISRGCTSIEIFEDGKWIMM